MTVLLGSVPATSAGSSSDSGRTWSWLASAGLAVSLLAGTSAHTAMPFDVRAEVAGLMTGTGGFAAPTPRDEPSTAVAIRRLRDRSGLSWDQIARVFGVSRRSVHKWATGGTLNAGHSTRLAYLAQLVNQLGDKPLIVRAQLLAPDDRGTTLFQQLIREVPAASARPGGTGIGQLLGARRDGDTTVLGDLVDAQQVNWPTPRR